MSLREQGIRGQPNSRRALFGVVPCALALILMFAAPASAATYDTRVASNDGSGEPEIAVNPLDSSNLVVAHVHGVSYSHDAGRHWHAASNPPTGGDPAVVADGSGRFYATYIAEQNGIRVYVSRDGGRTWSGAGDPLHGPDLPIAPGSMQVNSEGPVYMGPWALVACDREFLAADQRTGTLYASCADHGDASGGESGQAWELNFLACRANGFSSSILTSCGRRYISVSHDHGQTWTGWFPEDSADYPGGYTGAFAGVPKAARGVLAAAYVAGRASGSNCSPCAVFETSRNAGRTWSRHLIPAEPSIYSFSLSNPTGPNSAGQHVGNDSQNVWFEPYLAADPSNAGRFAVMLLDKDRTHLLVFVTRNSGASWSRPARLAGGQPGFRDKPSLAYAPDGSLGVVWKSAYPARSYSFDVWAAVAPHGDTHFRRPVRLNDATSPMQPCGVGMHGEAYTCDELDWTVMDNSNLHSAWGDARGGENPWYGRYAYPSIARTSCLARRSPIGPRNIGRVRLGYTRAKALHRIAVHPIRLGRYAYTWCVKRSRGRVRAVFSRGYSTGRARLVITTARGHGMRGVHPGVRSRLLRQRFPRARRVARGVYRASRSSRRIFGTRRGRVRFVGVANRRLLRSRRGLRGYLRRAGL
jgi:hypothetical protein